jgi:hypothetical protein
MNNRNSSNLVPQSILARPAMTRGWDLIREQFRVFISNDFIEFTPVTTSDWPWIPLAVSVPKVIKTNVVKMNVI